MIWFIWAFKVGRFSVCCRNSDCCSNFFSDFLFFTNWYWVVETCFSFFYEFTRLVFEVSSCTGFFSFHPHLTILLYLKCYFDLFWFDSYHFFIGNQITWYQLQSYGVIFRFLMFMRSKWSDWREFYFCWLCEEYSQERVGIFLFLRWINGMMQFFWDVKSFIGDNQKDLKTGGWF